MKRIVALFDCDGTLYSAQFGRGLLKYASENERKRAVQKYYANVLIPYTLGKLGLIQDEKHHRPVIAQLARLIRGLSVQEGDKAFDWVIENLLLPSKRLDVITRLHEHQVQGHTVVLVSGTLLPALARFAEIFGVTSYVGTKVEVEEGYYTGRIVPPVITGRDKDRCTRELLSSDGIQVDWNSSYAYADSITDCGMFSLVGHPIAVYPDAKLFDFARSGDWEIIGTPKN